jgi:hypothetical protein
VLLEGLGKLKKAIHSRRRASNPRPSGLHHYATACPQSISNGHLIPVGFLRLLKQLAPAVEAAVLNKFPLLLSEGKRFVLKICKTGVALGKQDRVLCERYKKW